MFVKTSSSDNRCFPWHTDKLWMHAKQGCVFFTYCTPLPCTLFCLYIFSASSRTHDRTKPMSIFVMSSKVTHFSRGGNATSHSLLRLLRFLLQPRATATATNRNRFRIPSKVAHFTHRELKDLSNVFARLRFLLDPRAASVVASPQQILKPQRSWAFLTSQLSRPRTPWRAFVPLQLPRSLQNRRKTCEISGAT